VYPFQSSASAVLDVTLDERSACMMQLTYLTNTSVALMKESIVRGSMCVLLPEDTAAADAASFIAT
jgi:hypothetical protein